MSLAHSTAAFGDRVFEELRGWPALAVRRAECGEGPALAAGDRQLLHLHSGDQAALRLTWPVIQRMGAALLACDSVTLAHHEDWLRVRLDSASDGKMLVSLVSVAIQANAAHGGETRCGVGACGPPSR